MTRAARLRVGLLLAGILSANASYTVLIPFVPELERRVHMDGLGLALTFALFAAAKALFQPVGGAWSDRWQARCVAFTGLGVVALSVTWLAFSTSQWELLAARVAWGAGEGILTPALYHGATLLCSEHRIPDHRMMGWFGTASVTGSLLGPVIAGAGSALGLTTLCVLGAAAAVATAFGVFRAIPQGARAGAVEGEEAEPSPDPGAGGRAPRHWMVMVLVFGVLDLVAGLGYSALEPTIPLYIAAAGESTLVISSVFTVGLATFALVSTVLGRVAEKWSVETLVTVGLVTGTVGTAGISLSNHQIPLMCCFALIMTGQPSVYIAARKGVAALRSAGGRLGISFGVFGAVSDLGEVVGPLAGSGLYALGGRQGFIWLAIIGMTLLTVVLGIYRRWSAVARPVTA
ncbi:MFS transporter [Actinacidiphila bryophytorum]|uniref:MFS transporter n=1 Tax=Actinacidiphila bryophytorum TaxID=1436133 RepID=UPI002176AC94|nr:MFS transporter [Actinacidiphila bryophytorum]UWE07319.1 MFS transporter [Actinacidiphila bryophytorum]